MIKPFYTLATAKRGNKWVNKLIANTLSFTAKEPSYR